MSIWRVGNGRAIKAAFFEMQKNVRIFDGDGFPKSGTAGTGASAGSPVFSRGAQKGSLYIDSDTGVMFFNEGTAASPYWTPTNFEQQGLLAWHSGSDFGVADVAGVTTPGAPLADTEASKMTSRGLVVNGQGVEEADAGLTVVFTATDGGGPVASLVATDQDAHLTQLTVGKTANTTPVFQPDQNGTMVIDASFCNLTDNDVRNQFIGFHGDGTLALDPIMTFATVTITNVGADIVGLARSSELTDTTGIFHVVFNASAGATLTTTNVDTGVNISTAGTYQRMRVEVDTDGVYRCFIAKALVATGSGVDADEEFLPSLIIESTDANTKTILVSHFQTWGKKVARP